MKRTTFLLLTLFAAFSIQAQYESITLNFTAQYQHSFTELDSILIENTDLNEYTTLYYPDTILTLTTASTNNTEFRIKPPISIHNYPNPFSGKTNINITIPESDHYDLKVFDITGRLHTYSNAFLEKGRHKFTFNAGHQQVYLLIVSSKNHIKRHIMINTGGSDHYSDITYNGILSNIKSGNSFLSTSEFPFVAGDELRFTGYITDKENNVHHAVITDTPESDTEYVFDITSNDPGESVTYEIHFIDVGQGDAILIITPEKVLLKDAGWNNSKAADYLAELDIEKIDIAIASHPHADHIGGFIDIFETFEVGEVIDNGVTHTTQTYNNYLTAIDENDIPYTVGRKGMERSLGENAYLEILHPPEPIPSYSGRYLNNASVVVKVTLGEITILLTGDVEQEGEADLMTDPGKLSSTILKVAHHGSNSSSTMEFLQAVEPEISVIMCGLNNQYGHPHQPVLDRLNTIGTTMYRTDLNGSIKIITDGIEYEVIVDSN